MTRAVPEVTLWLLDRVSAYDLRYNEDQPREPNGQFGSGGDQSSGEGSFAGAVDSESPELDADQRAAFESYRSFFGYRQINGQLRSGQLDQATQAKVDAMDRTMESSRLTDPAETYRGIRDGQVVFGQNFNGDLTGAQWTEHAYLSTAPTHEFANNWSQHGLGRDSDPLNPLVMTVRSPSGTGAVRMSDRELLLERGLSFRVSADHGVVGGIRQIDVEVSQ